MFSTGYEVASKFTQPLLVGIRFFDGSVEGGLGAFIVLNEDGWLMTAAHNLQLPFAHRQHAADIGTYETERQRIIADKAYSEAQREDLINRLRPDSKWVTDFTILLGPTAPIVEQHLIYFAHDIAFVKVDKKAVATHKDFPKIRDPASLRSGASLCKLGFPFYEIKPTFDTGSGTFQFPPNVFPIPRFPIEGIYTRNLVGEKNDGLDTMWLETSSPGLRGQSGGPIFDVDGNICAVQSQNVTLPLGFVGEIEINKTKVQESQFMNVGIGVHPSTIVALLRRHKINFEMA